MSLLTTDTPLGRPGFSLSADQIATVVDLVCQGAYEARANIAPGMLEVPTTRIVRKQMRRVKKALGLTNLQIVGEHELDDMTTSAPDIAGRIDIILQFMHQFGDEDAYIAVECKRVRAGDSALNRAYVTMGVDRFVTGQYAAGHAWGFMLGYVIGLPVDDIVAYVDDRIRNSYGDRATLDTLTPHCHALAVCENELVQAGSHPIRLKHVFVDMLIAAP
jgi:hypothetical protein